MSQGAYVGSIDAVRDFRAALHTFLAEIREAITSQDLEVRRTLEWILEAEPKRWQQELRRAEDAITQTKIELERCRVSKLPGGGTPSCIEEKKALDRARQRRDYVADKIDAVRKWGGVLGHEIAEYSGRAAQLNGSCDTEMPRALALLERVLTTLESYVALDAQVPPRPSGMAPDSPTDPVMRPQAAGPQSVPAATEPAPSPIEPDDNQRESNP
jgi:hypothetical protein